MEILKEMFWLKLRQKVQTISIKYKYSLVLFLCIRRLNLILLYDANSFTSVNKNVFG